MRLQIRKKKPAGYSYDPRTDGVSQSMLTQWLECREKARLSIVEGWEFQGARKPLIYGTIGHNVLCKSNRRHMATRKWEHCIDMLDQDIAEAHAEWLGERETTSEARDIADESMHLLGATLPHYYAKNQAHDSKLDWKIVEENFKVPIKMTDGETVFLVGKYDGVFEEKKNLCLYETKFKGRIPESMVDILAMDLQVCTYITSLRVNHGKNPRRALYNVLIRPGERRKQTERMVDFAERISANVAKDPNHYFQRFSITLTQQEAEAAQARVEETVSQFYWWWLTAQPGKRDLVPNTANCDGKYGVCDCLRICSAGDYSAHRVREKAHPELAQ